MCGAPVAGRDLIGASPSGESESVNVLVAAERARLPRGASWYLRHRERFDPRIG